MTRSRSRSRWARRCAAVALLAAFLPLSTVGCFGKFQLTRNLYLFNTEVSPDQWIQWLIFLGMSPFYGLSVAIDLVIANSWEFWGDENPIEPTPRRAQAPDGTVVVMTPHSGGGMDLVITRPDGAEERFAIVREDASLAVRSADGRLLARVADFRGRPAFVEGEVLAYR
jgi:hypothetical protein